MINMIKNKKQMFIIIGVFALVLVLGGTTYAWFNYSKTTSDNELIAGEIYLHLNEGQGEIELSNIFPETVEEARARNDNYITFDVEGINESTKTIYYEFILDHGTENSDPNKSRYTDSDLRFDLVELDNQGNETSYLLSNVGFDTLINKRIYVNTIANNTNSQTVRRYKLRMWLSDEVIISDTDPNRSYTTAEYKNKYATIKLIVAGDFQEKTAPKQAYNLIQSLSSSKNYIASYDDFVASNQNYSTFTTQDTVGLNNNKQTVYYYTESDAATNANVLFAGYCWQIVRTTDNGGVKLIYNGVAQKPVTDSIPMSNTDITYTNDSIYPYTYDTNTKKWTSANAGVASTTDTFTFTVNTAGDYAINYTISSQINLDVAKFYINNVLLGQRSGEEEGVFDLGMLATTDVIKIEYHKSGSDDIGNDNVIFDIVSIISRGVTPLCSNKRSATMGINGVSGSGTSTTSLASTSLYGRSYDYDLSTGQFTIEDSTGLPTAWSENDTNSNGKKDYEELIGTYTCKSSSSTCTTLYYVGSYYNSTNAYTISYNIEYVAHFSQTGKSAYNANYKSPALVGYMFNREYDYASGKKTGEYHTTAIWTGSVYSLTSVDIAPSSPDATHHYICDVDCTKVRYYYNTRRNTYYFIILEGGKTIEDYLAEMINYKTNQNDTNENINVYNSAIKGYLDNWYKKNLIAYTNYLDNNAIFCNDRSVSDLGGWNSNGTSIENYLQFYQYSVNSDLNCANETDRFSMSNNKAKLEYPIGLLSEPERKLMTQYFAKTGQQYWSGTPKHYDDDNAGVYQISESLGSSVVSYVINSYGVRPVIILKPGTLFESGDGTYMNPYIVGPIVERNEG